MPIRAGISGQQEYNTGEEASGQVENVDSEDNTAGTDDTMIVQKNPEARRP